MTAECGREGSDVEAQRVADAQRDPRRFAALYEANVDEVYAFVSRRVGSRTDAEDLTATVFHNALANLHRFEWRGVPFVAWLMRIAANELADWARQRARPVPQVAAQSTACPIADDSTVSQAVGSPMAGKVEGTATPSRSM